MQVQIPVASSYMNVTLSNLPGFYEPHICKPNICKTETCFIPGAKGIGNICRLPTSWGCKNKKDKGPSITLSI